MKKIYIVYGATGDYSDRTEWPVKAFIIEKDAQEFVKAVQKEADRLLSEYDNPWDIPEGANPLDPDAYTDYANIEYRYQTVPLADDVIAWRPLDNFRQEDSENT